jgi:serine/threonine-protein kinase HipA
MCTRVYPGLGSHFAFSIAGETDPGNLTAEHIVEMANMLGVGPKYVQKLGQDMAAAVDAAIPAAAAEVLPLLGPGQRVLVERITNRAGSLTRKISQRIAGGTSAIGD